MKIRLLHDGGFDELRDFNFPMEVEASRWKDSGYDVDEKEFGISTGGKPFFFVDSEVEVVE